MSEPSVSIKGAGSNASEGLDEVRPSVAEKIFKAMINAAIEEVVDDKN